MIYHEKGLHWTVDTNLSQIYLHLNWFLTISLENTLILTERSKKAKKSSSNYSSTG